MLKSQYDIIMWASPGFT